jgi:tRNA/rRNA methyltransferase
MDAGSSPTLSKSPLNAPPAVVLVQPEIAANVGFTARAMACYGCVDLRIVASPGLAASEAAQRTASGGEAVLSKAREYGSLPEAVADCTLALGFSRRVRDPAQRILDLSQATALGFKGAEAGSGPPGREPGCALVFGRESTGLSREESLTVTHLVRIPLVSETLSLNLSHAVAIALNAFCAGAAASGATDCEAVPASPVSQPVALGEAESILSALLAGLWERDFFKPAKAEAQADYIRLLWQRLSPTRRELEFLAGVLKKLGGAPKF